MKANGRLSLYFLSIVFVTSMVQGCWLNCVPYSVVERGHMSLRRSIEGKKMDGKCYSYCLGFFGMPSMYAHQIRLMSQGGFQKLQAT